MTADSGGVAVPTAAMASAKPKKGPLILKNTKTHPDRPLSGWSAMLLIKNWALTVRETAAIICLSPKG